MKKYYLPFLMTAVMILAFSCNSNSDDLLVNTSNIAGPGTWRVTLFTDSGNDETADFKGYDFTFGNGGILTVVKNGAATTGSWSVNSSSTRFTINLGPKNDANKPLGELTDDWKILSITETEIRLTDDNAASNEFLTFTKN